MVIRFLHLLFDLTFRMITNTSQTLSRNTGFSRLEGVAPKESFCFTTFLTSPAHRSISSHQQQPTFFHRHDQHGIVSLFVSTSHDARGVGRRYCLVTAVSNRLELLQEFLLPRHKYTHPQRKRVLNEDGFSLGGIPFSFNPSTFKSLCFSFSWVSWIFEC